MKSEDVAWGPVIVTAGPHKGRIGDLDEEGWEDDSPVGHVYFGTILLHKSNAAIPIRFLRHVTTNDLLKRSNALWHYLCSKNSAEDQLDAFHEYHYIQDTLRDRWLEAQERRKDGFGVFVSHSSKDQEAVRHIAVDIANAGFRPWLDEWEIMAGESIPKKISEGIEHCQVMLVVLSPESVQSGWVEREWHTKYWDEIQEKRVCVIPLLLKRCEIPVLLRPRKYANFSDSYADGFNELLDALRNLADQKDIIGSKRAMRPAGAPMNREKRSKRVAVRGKSQRP